MQSLTYDDEDKLVVTLNVPFQHIRYIDLFLVAETSSLVNRVNFYLDTFVLPTEISSFTMKISLPPLSDLISIGANSTTDTYYLMAAAKDKSSVYNKNLTYLAISNTFTLQQPFIGAVYADDDVYLTDTFNVTWTGYGVSLVDLYLVPKSYNPPTMIYLNNLGGPHLATGYLRPSIREGKYVLLVYSSLKQYVIPAQTEINVISKCSIDSDTCADCLQIPFCGWCSSGNGFGSCTLLEKCQQYNTSTWNNDTTAACSNDNQYINTVIPIDPKGDNPMTSSSALSSGEALIIVFSVLGLFWCIVVLCVTPFFLNRTTFQYYLQGSCIQTMFLLASLALFALIIAAFALNRWITISFVGPASQGSTSQQETITILVGLTSLVVQQSIEGVEDVTVKYTELIKNTSGDLQTRWNLIYVSSVITIIYGVILLVLLCLSLLFLVLRLCIHTNSYPLAGHNALSNILSPSSSFILLLFQFFLLFTATVQYIAGSYNILHGLYPSASVAISWYFILICFLASLVFMCLLYYFYASDLKNRQNRSLSAILNQPDQFDDARYREFNDHNEQL